jgi:hypothetical protein
VPKAKLLAVASGVVVGVWAVANARAAAFNAAKEELGSGVLIRFRCISVMIRSSRSSRWRLVRIEWDKPSFRCPRAPRAIRPPECRLFLASTMTRPRVVSPSNRRFRTLASTLGVSVCGHFL